VLWPDQAQPLRLTFDPEALPEHPSAQLLTFGLPLLDELLGAAQTRGQVAHAYYDARNLQPYRLEQQVRRDLTVPAGTALALSPPRPAYVAAEANSQQRARQAQAGKEIARMERYFADMAEELDTRMAKAKAKGEDIAPLVQRKAALEHEAATRIDELCRKAGVWAKLRLRNLLHLSVPRLFLRARLSGPKLPPI